MKKSFTLIVGVLLTINAFSQTSVQDGNWTDPNTWDCTCVPLPYMPTSIDVIVNHTVTADIYDPIFSLAGRTYFDGGSLTIGPTGTLLQTGNGDLWMQNATTLVDGVLDMRRVAINRGSAIYNGIIQNCDSLWNDSSTVINNGVVWTYDHQVYPDGIMTNNGTINMSNKMNIMGDYTNTATGEIIISVDFSNSNVFGGRAMYTNNGSHTVHNNFINTTNDTIKGTGTFCIGNLSTNQGTVLGNLTFTTPTGGFSLNTGFVAPPVVFNVGACTASAESLNETEVLIYPNPSTGIVCVTGDQISTIRITDISGKLIRELEANTVESYIDLSERSPGLYFVTVTSPKSSQTKSIILK